MRRRTKKKFTWFPVLPTDVEGVPGKSWYHNSLLVNPGDESGYQIAIPLTFDETVTDGNAPDGGTLNDRVQGQEYIIERIVGQYWGGVGQDPTADNSWRVAILACALAVVPYNNDGSLGLTNVEFDPLGADNSDKSYMFRRTTTLYNNLQPNAPIYLGATNVTNCGPDYGFIDARSVRRVKRDERAVIIFSLNFMENVGNPTETEFNFGYDVRLLGAMRKAKNDSSLR